MRINFVAKNIVAKINHTESARTKLSSVPGYAVNFVSGRQIIEDDKSPGL